MIKIANKLNKESNAVSGSLCRYLTVIEPTVSPNIIEHHNWQNIKAIANLFPQSISNFFGFEYRLGNDDFYTDFLLCVSADETGKKVIGDADYQLKLPASLTKQPEWQHLANFSRVWCQSDSILADAVHNIWLEFDIEPSVATKPVPCIFFGLLPTEIADTTHNFDWITDTAIPLLLNRSVSDRVKENVDRCFATLPTGAYIFQVGLMLSRQTDTVRLCIRNIKPQEIISWLQQMAWNGCTTNLAQLLQELDPLVDRIDLDIDVGEVIYPKIGLECYLSYQPSFQPKWALFFDYLVKLGLCTSQKQHKLLNFSGYDRLTQTNGERKLEQLLGKKQENILFRGLHHIKLSYKDNRVTEAKAYLYVSRNRIDVREFKAQAEGVRGVNIC